MVLRDELLRSGTTLFRRRAYLPLLVFIVSLAGLVGYRYPAGRQALDLVWELVCLSISLVGMGIRAFTLGCVPLGTSGRGTLDPSAPTLNTTGTYSIVRHPLYLGNYLIWLGLAMLPREWYLPVLATLAFWLGYERIILAEEAFLERRFGAEFLEWAASTPAFIPAFRQWQPPRLPFSLRAALSREYYTLPIIVIAFSVFDAAGDFVVTGALRFDRFWVISLSFAALSFVVLRFLVKKTTLLRLADR